MRGTIGLAERTARGAGGAFGSACAPGLRARRCSRCDAPKKRRTTTPPAPGPMDASPAVRAEPAARPALGEADAVRRGVAQHRPLQPAPRPRTSSLLAARSGSGLMGLARSEETFLVFIAEAGRRALRCRRSCSPRPYCCAPPMRAPSCLHSVRACRALPEHRPWSRRRGPSAPQDLRYACQVSKRQ